MTARISRAAPDAVRCQAWGPGAQEFLDNLPALLGWDDDAAGFEPEHPVLAAAKAKVPHLRDRPHLPRAGGADPRGAGAAGPGRRLVPVLAAAGHPIRHTRARPGACRHAGSPPAQVWRRIPSWEFHRANVDPGRARTVIGCAERADSLERLATRPADEAREALTTLRGVGVDGRRDRPTGLRRRRRARSATITWRR